MHRLKPLICVCVVGSTALLAAGVARAAAANFTVNQASTVLSDANAGDGICEATPGMGDCNLRAAAEEASSDTGSADVIGFLPSLGPIAVSTDINLLGPVTIDGTGSGDTAADTVIDGGDSSRLFHVITGLTTDVTFRDMRIVDGLVDGTDGGGGGAIRTGAPTTLNNVVIDSSAATANTVAASGAAIRNISSADTLTIQNSVISGNTITTGAGLPAAGAGIATAGPLVLTNSVVTDNSITGGGIAAQGGGISADAGFAITDSTIRANSVSGSGSEGAGIFTGANPAARSIVNSTISGNIGTAAGGGGAHLNADTTITNVTFKNNAGSPGADLTQSAGTSTVRNTIFDSAGACGVVGVGTISTATPGHNIDVGTSCGFLNTQGNMSSTDPMLQTGLIQFGAPPGQSLHIAFATSPAIDNADPTCGGGLTHDQRGLDRPQGGAGNCDIGAYERDYRDLDVEVSGSGTVTGTGINCVNNTGDCAHEFLDGGPGFVLTATPAAGFQFSSWSAGGCSSITGDQCTVDTGNDRMITATFTAIPSSGGGGTTTPAPTTPPKKCKKGKRLKKGKCVKKKKKRKK